MVKVNLLPPKERTKKQVIKENLIAIFLSVIALLLIAGFSALLFFYENSLQGKIKSTQGDIATQQEKNNNYKDVEKLVTDLNKNIEKVGTLQKKYPKWSKILNQIRERTPVDIQLSEISSPVVSASLEKGEGKEKAPSLILTIKGFSKSQYTIMKLKEALTTLSLFDYVDFESSTWQKDKAKYEFVLKAKLKT